MKLKGILLAMSLYIAFTGIVFAEDRIEGSAQVVQNNSETALAYSNRASAKFLKKDFKGAVIDFDKAIELSPNNPELYLNRGYLKHVMRDFDGAMNDYNKAISLNKGFAFAYNNRGVLKVAMNDTKGALEDYAKALEINKKYSDVYYNRANLKYMLDDNKGALEDYNIAIELNPKDAEAFNNRGVVKKRMNFNVGALSDYSQAIALNPKDSIAYANRGRLKKLYFDNEGAAIDLDQAVALAETQTFIKNVKPLLSNERYIAAIPAVEGNSAADFAQPVKANPIIAKAEPKPELKPQEKIASADIKPISEQKIKKEEPQTSQQIALKKPEQKVVPTPEDKPVAGAISAGVATVQVPSAPVITTTAVKKNPTTNVKLAESYYIRGLQKCVLKDLKGAIADLNKAIENNSKYADAYYYRAAIRKELGDAEGFRKDYSTAIQINPELQAFNDSNCLTLISG